MGNFIFSALRFAFCIINSSLFIASCTGTQSALDPAGPQASRISDLWWLLFAVCTIVFLLVVGFLLYAVGHRRREGQPEEPRAERRRVTAVSVAVAVTIVIMFVLLITSIRT